ncbi:MAG: hypothetical protein Q9186_007642 [Xanthomendoza sp. 1 TL-2023]
MHPFAQLSFLPLIFWIASPTVAIEQLLEYVDGGNGNLLGSAFGAPGTNATFDYVILGGGTAGLTIATRLAQDPAISVAVVEAGGFYEIDNGNRSIVPGYANFYTGADPENYQPLVDWGFTTVPQQQLANRRVHYARGKTLGGSSARHYMIYHRPTVGSMQKWANEVGDESYTWDRMLPFYQKSCNYTPYNPELYNSTIFPQPQGAFDPAGGPLQVSFSNYADAFGTWAQKAFIAVGMKVLPDGLNAGVLNGSAYSTLTIDPRNGHRSSSESSFLQAALQNGTAPTIYKNSLAQRILFNGTVATAVLVTTAGPYGVPPLNYTLTARKEVILSAGAFQTPQLLMVSGIGPKATLQQHGISVLKDLAGVGQNMWDHILFGANRRVEVLTGSASLNNPASAARLAAQFRINGSGPLAAFGAGYYGWEDLPQPYRGNLSRAAHSALETFPSDWPELEWLPISAYLGYQTNRQTEDPRDGYNYASINAGLIAPLSRGNVTISSAEMTDPPILNPNWLSDPTDQELAVQSFRRSCEIWSVLAANGITVGDSESLPGFDVSHDADILAYIQKSLMTIYHASSTCKMGRFNDSMAVVDSQARVYGIQNLRIVDASAFPFLPPGHPQATVYALAEKIAADIWATLSHRQAIIWRVTHKVWHRLKCICRPRLMEAMVW